MFFNLHIPILKLFQSLLNQQMII